jgi:hypothetical protein
MTFNQRSLQLAGELRDSGAGLSLLYDATATILGGGLIRVDGQCGPTQFPNDTAEFSFVYVPEMHDVIVYSIYKLDYINSTSARAECCANIAFSNPYYFEDIGEMCAMAPCICTRAGRITIFLRPLIKAILGENILHQLTLPIERYAYYRR